MEAPLLETSTGDVHLIGDNGDYLPMKGLKAWWRVFCIESAKLWRIGGPIAFQILCQYGTTSVTTVFVGHLGDIELSAFSIALSVVCTFSFGFMLGMGSALETLCGQAYGAGQVHMLGIYMQRSIIILLATCVLVSPLYIFATPILKLLGQQDEIADLAGTYTLLVLPQLCSLAIVFPTQKFLQAQSKVSVLAWIAASALASQILLCWLFVYVFGWGTRGVAVAFDISNWGMAIAQFVYVVGWCKDGWKGFSWAAFNEIWAFVKLSFASAIMICLEIWYMMSILILTGHLSNSVTAVGSLSICMNVDSLETMVFIGINAAISVRVSNELGMGHPRAARYSVHVTLFQSLLLGILFMIVILATRNHFSIIFTNSEEMQRAVSHLSGLLGITMLLNSVAVGGGWQGLVAYINVACYYVFWSTVRISSWLCSQSRSCGTLGRHDSWNGVADIAAHS
ncbi:UNVERIFIED_CONTAM: protein DETOXIFICATION 35, partial [Sesamum angustifolium]